jgi:hypothetical protein
MSGMQQHVMPLNYIYEGNTDLCFYANFNISVLLLDYDAITYNNIACILLYSINH